MTYTVEFIREKITTDEKWTCHAILALYERQTESERSSGTTQDLNGIGFNGVDAPFMTSLALSLQNGRHLSYNQLKAAQKVIRKYARQLTSIANEES